MSGDSLTPNGFHEFINAFNEMPADEKRAAIKLADELCAGLKWIPNPGPQTEAYYCDADELFYGGAGGGGKTALICGLAVNEHFDIQMFRREATQLRGLIKELTDIIGNANDFNSTLGIWRLPSGQTIELAGVKEEGDKEKWQGRAADLKAFDEITHFSRSQYRFIIGWNRSTRPGQRCRVVATGNPPLTAEGLWVIKHWAPWLDETHPDPALPGELRWPVRTTDNDDENEIFFRTKEDALAHLETLKDAPRDYDGKLIAPRSRTFIPAKLEDNPDLMQAGYAAVLNAMPKEIRDAIKDGKFNASLADQPMQVIPTEWIMQAQARWKPDGYKESTMTAMGYDPAGGGRDDAVLAWRHGDWYAPIVAEHSPKTADGSWSAALIVKHRRDRAPVVVDVGGGAGHGFGGTTIMRLNDNEVTYARFDGSAPSIARTEGGGLRFANKRAEAWWRMREALDPDKVGGSQVQLPPDPELRADLAAPTFESTKNGIQLESKKQIRVRLGRSPGRGDAVVMCNSEGAKAVARIARRGDSGGMPVMANLGGRQLHRHGSQSRARPGHIEVQYNTTWKDEQN